MATGIVRGLVGSVTVTNTRGVTRQLRTGDTVELNDTVQAANGSTVHIAFDNGNFATVGSNEKLVLDASVIDPMAESDNKAATDLSVADIQAMIAAGADPTEIAEATAAGADAGNPMETRIIPVPTRSWLSIRMPHAGKSRPVSKQAPFPIPSRKVKYMTEGSIPSFSNLIPIRKVRMFHRPIMIRSSAIISSSMNTGWTILPTHLKAL